MQKVADFTPDFVHILQIRFCNSAENVFSFLNLISEIPYKSQAPTENVVNFPHRHQPEICGLSALNPFQQIQIAKQKHLNSTRYGQICIHGLGDFVWTSEAGIESGE